jgi:hypothetical protein
MGRDAFVLVEIEGRYLQIALAETKALLNAILLAVEPKHLLGRERPVVGDQQVTTIETLGLVQRRLPASPEEIDLTG